MALETQQKLVLSVIEFLNQSIQDGTVASDDREGLEVAVQCIGEAFGIDLSDKQQCERLSVKPATLQSIFDVFLKTRAKARPEPTSIPSDTQPSAPSADDKAKAEKSKQSGNTQMSAKNYDQAIESYTQAIALDGTNPVYYSNRAAAHSSKGDHSLAVGDSEKAIEVDPSFVKAYSRLGHAHYSLGQFEAASSAFKKGLELDPSNANLKSGFQNAQAHCGTNEVVSEDAPRSEGAPNLGNMADLLRGMGGPGGAGGAGGMPDLASILSNPAMMQMAQQLMQNGGLESLMSNPGVANMMNRARSGGGMPSMEDIMADPALRNMASQFGVGGTGSQ